MDIRNICIFTLFNWGMVVLSSAEVRNNVYASGAESNFNSVSQNPSSCYSQNQPVCDLPFIRLHKGKGIEENKITISIPTQSVTYLKPAKNVPEKFAGIINYLSSSSRHVPFSREFAYSTLLRAPPILS